MKRANKPKTVYRNGMVVTQKSIERFVLKLPVERLHAVTEGLELVADRPVCIQDVAGSNAAGSNAAGSNTADRFDPDALRAIEQAARKSKGKRYRRLLKALAQALQEGEGGIEAARMPASCALELIARLTRCGYVAMVLEQALENARLRTDAPVPTSTETIQINPGSDESLEGGNDERF